MSEPLKRPAITWKQSGHSMSPSMMQVVECRCLSCGFLTRMPGPSIIDAAERHWRERYEGLLGALNEAVAMCHRKYGTDPMREEFSKRLQEIRDRFGCGEGDEWKRGRGRGQ